MGNLLVVGSLNMDTVVNVSKIPQRGETILGKEISYIPGGKGANQAYAMAKLGADVTMIGCIGADANGVKLIQNLHAVHVNTKAIQVFEKQPTGTAFITVEETGENSIIVIPGANFELKREWIVQQQSYIDDCDVVVTQLETPIDSVCAVAELAKQKGKKMLLDPAPACENLPESLLKNVSILKPNETELQILTGQQTDTEQQIVSAAKTLIDKGVEKVVVTLGEKGAMLVTENGYKMFPSKNVKAVDTTAAGDAFTAGLALKLSEGCTCEEAIQFATKVSSIVVTRKGAQTSIPTYEEVLEV
ncbi:ribokinase [Lachnospiraceae bacterium 46-61]